MTSKDIMSGQSAGHPDAVSGPSVRTAGQRLPGIRYRTKTSQRTVPHTVNGKTRMIEEDYDALVPVPPRDWDHTVTTAVTIAAALLVAVAVVWSIASIGDLLARAVVAPIAYLAASAFALAWVTCMALEWLARYDAARAAGPRTAGNWALAVDMAAVATHGWVKEDLYVGLAAAAVSGVAKAMWTVVMRHQARPLPERTAKWLLHEEAEIAARLALAGQLRTLARAEAQAAVYAPLPAADTRPDTTGADTDTLSGRHVRTVHAAVRAASASMPDAAPEDIVAQLAAAGITTDEDTVRTVLGPDTNSADTTDSRSQPRVRSIAPRGQSVADSVRTALASGITAPDAVLAYVRGLHGQTTSADTVARTRRRVETEMAS
ncbi:protein transporter Sec31 [Streptomyces hebeiensis]